MSSKAFSDSESVMLTAPALINDGTPLPSRNNESVAVVTYEGKRIEVAMVRVDTQRFYDQEWLAARPHEKQP